jgi:DNA polymerase type B, organellar and viral
VRTYIRADLLLLVRKPLKNSFKKKMSREQEQQINSYIGPFSFERNEDFRVVQMTTTLNFEELISRTTELTRFIDVFNEVLSYFSITAYLERGTPVSITIHGTELSGRVISFYTYPTPIRDLNWYTILDQLAMKLNSAEAFLPELKITLIAHLPLNGQCLKKTFEMPSNKFLAVTTVDEKACETLGLNYKIESQKCFAQSIMYGLIYNDFVIPGFNPVTLKHQRDGKFGRIRATNWVCEQIGHCLYPQTNELMNQVANYFQMRILIFDDKGDLYYKTDMKYTKKIYLLLRYYDEKQANGLRIQHFDCITKFSAFLSCVLTKSEKQTRDVIFCDHCDEYYRMEQYCNQGERGKKKRHQREDCIVCHPHCTARCSYCYRLSCALNVNDLKTNCRKCCKTSQNIECSQLHKCVIEIAKKCEKCNKFHYKNSCTSRKCKDCHKWHEPNECGGSMYQPTDENFPKASTNIFVWDMETVVDTEGVQHFELLSIQRMLIDNEPLLFYNIEAFLCFLKENCLGYVGLAHNAKAFDNVILKTEFALLNPPLLPSSEITRGQKIMQMVYSFKVEKKYQTIRFLDSTNFFASKLSELGGELKCIVKKGYFPYTYYTKEWRDNGSHPIPKPPLDAFRPRKTFKIKDDPETMKRLEEKEEKELVEFYNSLPEMYDMKYYCEEYNKDDTRLLLEIVTKLRTAELELTKKMVNEDYEMIGDEEIKPFEGVDLFQFVTLASATFRFFSFKFITPEQFVPIDPTFFRERRLIAMQSNLITVNEVENCQVINERVMMYRVCRKGCPYCYNIKDTHVKEFNETLIEKRKLEAEGFQVEILWECQGFPVKDTDVFRRDEFPLIVRDCFHGGTSEVYVHDGRNCLSKIAVIDYVSQYPTMMCGQHISSITGEVIQTPYPVGNYYLTKTPDFSKEGVVKIKFVIDKSDLEPFIPISVMGKDKVPETIYGTCYTCIEQRFNGICIHSEEERAIIATITYPEVRYLLKNFPARILQVYDAVEYPEKSCDLFKDFLLPFFKVKSLSKRKGIVNENQFTRKGLALVDALNRFFPNEEFTTDQFEDNDGLRLISKLHLNAFYGKFGQKDVQRSSDNFNGKNVENVKRYMKLRGDSSVEWKSELYCSDFAFVSFEKKLSHTDSYLKKNDVIAAYTTAYGRLHINSIVNHLKKSGCIPLYIDTDSVYFAYENEKPITTGYGLGDMELECDDIKAMYCQGRKDYAYKNKFDQIICKVKGIHNVDGSQLNLNEVHENFMNSAIRTYTDFGIDTKKDSETGLPFKKIKNSQKNVYRGQAKRIIVDDGKRTIAFGNF